MSQLITENCTTNWRREIAPYLVDFLFLEKVDSQEVCIQLSFNQRVDSIKEHLSGFLTELLLYTNNFYYLEIIASDPHSAKLRIYHPYESDECP